MKNDNWIRNTNKVREWLEAEDRGQSGEAISLSITLGDTCGDDDLRSTYWTAIRSIGAMFEDFPKAKPGNSGLPTEIQVNVDSVETAVYNAFVTLPEFLLKVILPHGRTGGAFETIEEMATHFSVVAVRNLTKGYKENRWDGTMNGDTPMMTPPEKNVSEGGNNEE